LTSTSGFYFPANFRDLAVNWGPDVDPEWAKSAQSLVATTPGMSLLIVKSKAGRDIDDMQWVLTQNKEKDYGHLSVYLERSSTPHGAKTKMETLIMDVNGRKAKVVVLIIITEQTEYIIQGFGNDDAFEKLGHDAVKDYRWKE
jgi:hypothetical protein